MSEQNAFELLRDALVEDLLATIDAMEEDVPFESVKLDTGEQLERYVERRDDAPYWEQLLDQEGWWQTIHDAKILERRYRRQQDAGTDGLAGEVDSGGPTQNLHGSTGPTGPVGPGG